MVDFNIIFLVILFQNDPLLDQVGSSAQEQDERPREPTPGIALSGERSSSERGVTPEQGEEMDDTSGGGGGGAGVLPPGGEMSDMDTFEYLTRLPQFQLIRNAVQSNPAVLEPLLQTLQTQNPELFEASFLFFMINGLCFMLCSDNHSVIEIS